MARYDDKHYYFVFKKCEFDSHPGLREPSFSQSLLANSGEDALSSLNSRIHCLLELPRGPHRRHHVEHFLCCPIGCHGNLVFRTCYLVTTRSLLYVVTGT
jgi:hypothetical protein